MKPHDGGHIHTSVTHKPPNQPNNRPFKRPFVPCTYLHARIGGVEQLSNPAAPNIPHPIHPQTRFNPTPSQNISFDATSRACVDLQRRVLASFGQRERAHHSLVQDMHQLRHWVSWPALPFGPHTPLLWSASYHIPQPNSYAILNCLWCGRPLITAAFDEHTSSQRAGCCVLRQ
jgi:hypothetical protein